MVGIVGLRREEERCVQANLRASGLRKAFILGLGNVRPDLGIGRDEFGGSK
jgi:hypothetical protein